MKQIQKKCRLPPVVDYNKYTLSYKELIEHIVVYMLFTALISWLFYDSYIAFALVIPFTIMTLKSKKESLCKKRRQKLETEFKDVILSVSSNLQAGYSVENAFGEAYQEIAVLYGKGSVMAVELKLMFRKLGNNEQLEDILTDLAKRSGVADIRDFADIFQIAKRSGGDLRSIIANTAAIIGDKQEVRREIETVISDKRLEQMIMRYIPFFIMFYISLTSRGYFESLYHNILGWIVMTAGLIVYFMACRLSDKILDIEV